MTRRADRADAARVLASPSRMELLHLLRTRGPGTVDELARATGLHANTVREHLGRLEQADLVRSESEHRTTRGRPRRVYRPTSAAEALAAPGAVRRLEDAIAQTALTRALVVALGEQDAGPRAVAAGRDVGRSVAPATAPARDADADADADDADRQLLALEAHLAAFGFDPELDPRPAAAPAGPAFHLWRCPFRDLARERPDVVCGVHAGLAQGVLDQAGGPLEVEALTPFVGPGHCVLSLRARPDDDGAGGRDASA